MAGKVFFRKGEKHTSRHVDTFVVPTDLLPMLAKLVWKRIPRQEFMLLVRAIAIARAENQIHTKARATRKDALAQLKAMLRLKSDDNLLHALRGCDRMTYAAIQQAQIDAISKVLWRDGVFVDSLGMEYRTAPSIELGVEQGQSVLVPPYLPMGFEGVRNAVAVALKNIEDDDVGELADVAQNLCLATRRLHIHPKIGAGNAEKTYQLDLARECLSFWKKNITPDPKIHASPRTGSGSPLVAFAVVVFSEAGMQLSPARARDVLNKAK